ncbi:hypothetical protein H4R34_000159 [Dimargaris verticillata]|uniref:ICE2-domain-containing protein n=1 Tax=Dimargaris verticillata TaxID=2761393 RepID=A0A9W8EG65_9FUNG|nr:hypothetical protein H4R34_000159 [Dimargaris verticillata]
MLNLATLLVPLLSTAVPLTALPAVFALNSYRVAIRLPFALFAHALAFSVLRSSARWGRHRSVVPLLTAGEAVGTVGICALALLWPDSLDWVRVPALVWGSSLWLATPVSLTLEALATFVVLFAIGRASHTWVTEPDDDDATTVRLWLLAGSSVGYLAPLSYLYSLFTGTTLTVATAGATACLMTAAFILGIAAMACQRGTVAEAAALFLYTAFGIYFALDSSPAISPASTAWASSLKQRLVSLPASLIRKLANAVLYPTLNQLFPYSHAITTVAKVYSLRLAAALLYRVVVIGVAAYIIRQLLRDARGVTESEDEEDSDLASTSWRGWALLHRVADFTRPLWIIMYTHSLLHCYPYLTFDDAWWRWFATTLCIALYGLNLVLDQFDPDAGLLD